LSDVAAEVTPVDAFVELVAASLPQDASKNAAVAVTQIAKELGLIELNTNRRPDSFR
jgi:hypothetical protein